MDLGFFDVPSSETLDFIDSFAGVTVTNLNELSGELLRPGASSVDPALHHLAGSEAHDAYTRDFELLSGWRNAVEVAFMGALAAPPGHYCFVVGKYVLDAHANVGESSAMR